MQSKKITHENISTLDKLKSGQLKGTKNLVLACALKEFPRDIFTLSETLEVLDMTDNHLTTLPDDFNCLKNLRILFLSNNNFTILPSVLAKCPKLSMIGFRNNHINFVEENALPLSTRWLILTDNALESLPNSMGELTLLQKCMLSGNQLKALPKSMGKCHNLELLRISANKLTILPLFLLDLPKLAWLAYSGNPFCQKHPSCDTVLKEVSWKELKIQEVLGEGASGVIIKALFEEREVAIKIFKGEMTSDGLPKDEMDINISMGTHTHLIDVLGRVIGHPEGKDVLMLELIPSIYTNLGLPPTLETCSRDVYPEGFSLSLNKVYKILQGMVKAAVHMHEHGIMHGDFYAHNIMIDPEANSILGDFGGASYFEPKNIQVRNALERLEIRAFGCLVEEMLILSKEDKDTQNLREKLLEIKVFCLHEDNEQRPLFKTLQTNF